MEQSLVAFCMSALRTFLAPILNGWAASKAIKSLLNLSKHFSNSHCPPLIFPRNSTNIPPIFVFGIDICPRTSFPSAFPQDLTMKSSISLSLPAVAEPLDNLLALSCFYLPLCSIKKSYRSLNCKNQSQDACSCRKMNC